jgi:hypothetical protein
MSYTPNNPNGQATMANSAPVVIASNQSPVDIKLANQGVLDTFGKLKTSTSRNDVDVQFYRDNPNNSLTVTSANGGTATQQTGFAQFSTSTAAAGSVTGVTLDKTHYHSGGELYAMVAVAFLSGGQATSFQRVGLFDTSNGFYVGYENTTFGISVRNAGVDTFTAASSFNVDLLNGNSNSKFTRNGVPEAINLTLMNVFRIRFGWLGAAAVKFEVLSPDDEWVLFHIIRQPNLSATPHIANADLPITLQLTKTAGATNIQVNTTCWGAGIQYENHDWNVSNTLGTAVNSVVEYNISSLGSCNIFVATTTTGTFIFEVTVDGKTWFTHPNIVDPNIGGTDFLISSAITPTSGAYYKIPVTGFRGLRARTATTLGAAVTLFFVGDAHDMFHDMTPPPHNIGYTQVHRDGEYTTTQTTTALWIPTTGRRFLITDMTISVGGSTGGIVTVFDSAASTAFSAGTTPAIFRGDFKPTTQSSPGIIKTFPVPYTSTTVNNRVHVTTSGAMTVYIQINGYEI